MLYEEFVKGTGCKVSEYNYQVYKDLELIYNNSDKTKEEIYEYGKKLVDNSKTPEQLQLEAEVKEEIKDHKAAIEDYKRQLANEKDLINNYGMGNKDLVKYFRDMIKYHRNKVTALKWILEA